MTQKERSDLQYTRWTVIFLLFVTGAKSDLHGWEKWIATLAAVVACIYAVRSIYFTFAEVQP